MAVCYSHFGFRRSLNVFIAGARLFLNECKRSPRHESVDILLLYFFEPIFFMQGINGLKATESQTDKRKGENYVKSINASQ